MTPELGKWYRIVSGPHRGRSGVCDLIQDYPSGRRYRITNREMIVGRFAADQLAKSTHDVYASQISPETYQRALDLLTKRPREVQS
jgi:hypothetical protein